MSDCSRFEPMFERFLTSELDPQSVSDLLAHTASCEDCRRLLSIHGDLTGAGARVPEPDESEFDFRQERVLRQVSRRRSGRRLRVAALAAGLILPFAVGLLIGRATVSTPGASARLMDSLYAEAASNRALADVEDSPFTYSNVSYRRLPHDRVALDFDVTTHLAAVESIRSPLAREIVAQSLLNPASVGERLKAMSFAAGGSDPTVEKAVLFALRRDDSVAVRLAALTVLCGRLDDDAVRAALMDSLRDDPSVQVRLAALESLAARPVDRSKIREALRVRPAPGNEALVVRLAEIEKQL